MIEHRGMLNHLLAKVHDLGLTAEDKIAQIAVQTFDVSIWQFLVALLVGGRTVIFTGSEAWEPSHLLTQLFELFITIVESVPSHTDILLNEIETHTPLYSLASLRWYISNGEPMPLKHCERWFKIYPHIPLMNAYGPTECSDDVAHFPIYTMPEYDIPYVPIQTPISNMQLYILDDYLNPMLPGVTGEIYIGGTGIARGYYKDPQQTAHAFLADPFSKAINARLYRSGDLGRYHKNGLLELLGRKDFQLKIRGFRVEATEIEQRLLQHPQVETCLVNAWRNNSNTNHIVGYIVANTRPAPSAITLQNYCRQHLPDYMVPSYLIILDELPLIENGKIDRSKLPLPTQSVLHHADNYVAPKTPLEKQLTELWAAILNIKQVGIQDNFFQIGGHSLVAAELITAMKPILNENITLRMLFEMPTIESFLSSYQAKLEEITL